jgi:hypothetical protein
VDPFHEGNGPARSIDRLKNFCNAIEQALIDDMFRHQLHRRFQLPIPLLHQKHQLLPFRRLHKPLQNNPLQLPDH